MSNPNPTARNYNPTGVSGLTRKQKAVIDAELDPKLTTKTAVAKAAGCTRQGYYKMMDKPEVQTALEKKRAKIVKLGKASMERIKKAVEKLDYLLEQDNPSAHEFNTYISILAGVAKTAHDLGWDAGTDSDEISPEMQADLRDDLHTIIRLARNSADLTPPEQDEFDGRLVNEYIETGAVPDISLDPNIIESDIESDDDSNQQ